MPHWHRASIKQAHYTETDKFRKIIAGKTEATPPRHDRPQSFSIAVNVVGSRFDEIRYRIAWVI